VIVVDENERSFPELQRRIERWCPERVVGHRGGGRAAQFTGREDVEIPTLLPRGSTFVTTNVGDFYGQIDAVPGAAIIELDLGKTGTPKEVSDILHRLFDMTPFRGQAARARRVIRIKRSGSGYILDCYTRRGQPDPPHTIWFSLDRREPPRPLTRS
jgi:hypothetical protein